MSVRSQEPHGRDGTPCRPMVDDLKQANAELELIARGGRPGVPSLPVRKSLPHAPPLSLPDDAIWFVTICCRERFRNQLALEPAAAMLLKSALFFHQQGRWFIHLFLLMPDHLHALLSFPQHEQMTRVVSAWKKYQATHHGITWQRDFFDHRLRRDESFAEKADYIRLNLIRAGLVFHPEEWPYVLALDGRDGTPLPRVANPADGTECRPYRK